MSLFISTFSSNGSDLFKNAPTPLPTPTLSEEAHILDSSGHSVVQIATFLGISTSQVDSALSIKSTPVSDATAVVAEAPGLSVHV